MTLRTRLTLWFTAIALAAIAVVWLYVTPQLESQLLDERLEGIASQARRYTPPIAEAVDSNLPAERIDRIVRDAADDASARVTLLGINQGTEGFQSWLKSDSTRQVEIRDLQFAVALVAARERELATGTEAGSGGRLGEVAVPLFSTDPETQRAVVGSVVVFSAPVADVGGSVDLVRERILVAAGLALGLAMLAGLAVAGTLSRRVKRLEQVAGRVAGGDFTARFPVDSPDELGQLARGLDDMQRQLAELDNARKRFIAVASHELRTPIFSLSGFLELLEDDDVPDADRARFMTQLRMQVDRLGKLAVDLLDLSRLEAGSLELRPEPTDLGALTRAVTAEFAPALDKHGSTLDVRVGGERIEVVCDPGRVAQVLRILIDNALTHTPSGTGVVVSAVRDNGAVRLAVSDDGPGMSNATAQRVFEPFFTSGDEQGSGLGLTIARELAERMHGSLAVEPAPGRTTFSLELPA